MKDESERRAFGGGNSSFVTDTIIQVRNAVGKDWNGFLEKEFIMTEKKRKTSLKKIKTSLVILDDSRFGHWLNHYSILSRL